MLDSIVRRLRGSPAAPPLDASHTVPAMPAIAAPGQQDAASFQLEGPLEGFELPAGRELETPLLDISGEHALWLSVAHSDRRTGSLKLASRAEGEASWTRMATLDLRGAATPGLHVPLAALKGRRSFRLAHVGDEGGSCRITLLRVCAAHEAGRVNGLSGYRERLAREVQHFSGKAYTHAMYGEGSAQGHGQVQAAVAGPAREAEQRLQALAASAREAVGRIAPQPGEVAFNYAMRALSALLPLTPPDFFQRAHDRSLRGPMRILSILAGAARVEEQMVGHCTGEVELVLMDASLDLIQRAADRLSASRPGLTVSCLVGDINNGLPGEGRFDVIVCVSALHHVPALERVLAQVNDRLTDDGEFWNIGEQVGRNGNRLWPEAYAEANRVFGALPAKYRRNAHTGKTDAAISDHDYSTGCFEGIRSEELETLLEAHFVPVDVYKRNAFLWRLVDATYSDNFVLEQLEDLMHLRELVVAEAVHWAAGGRATELHGVYRKKLLKP